LLFVLVLEILSESVYWKHWKHFSSDLEKIHSFETLISTPNPPLTKNEDVIACAG